MQPRLSTPKALALAGLSLREWEYIVPMFRGAPLATPPSPRLFDVDDIVCLFIIDHYGRLGVSKKLVGQIATDARELLACGDVDTLWITNDVSGWPFRVTTTEPVDRPRTAFPAAVIRAEIERAWAELA